jgi:hypothetical protein
MIGAPAQPIRIGNRWRDSDANNLQPLKMPKPPRERGPCAQAADENCLTVALTICQRVR